MRVLIVGDGIAGLTLAALLQQRGIHPPVVEKAPGYGGVGYVLALWPLGSRILRGLGLYQAMADELSRADAASIDLTICLFVKRRRRRVDSVQSAPCRPLRLSPLKSGILTAVRNRAASFLGDKQLLGSLVKVLETPF